ncbi:hypothetical protein HPP92_012822 [Vanilla planifolia]|uniref:C2H2-type domain-containing protein n=1 Tax=Vanilla planifolia TaxID=51239 RepID=A0A835UY74_VANPL|nr:hypothetical protein HPP92_012822 [Vanilla planifolia]
MHVIWVNTCTCTCVAPKVNACACEVSTPNDERVYLRYANPDINMADVEETNQKTSISRGIRRYFCEYCGICRSTKSIIKSHILTHHKDEVHAADNDEGNLPKEATMNAQHTCEDCGASFRNQLISCSICSAIPLRELSLVQWRIVFLATEGRII